MSLLFDPSQSKEINCCICVVLRRLAPSCVVLRRLAPSCAVMRRLAPSCAVLRRLAPSCAVMRRLAPSAPYEMIQMVSAANQPHYSTAIFHFNQPEIFPFSIGISRPYLPSAPNKTTEIIIFFSAKYSRQWRQLFLKGFPPTDPQPTAAC